MTEVAAPPAVQPEGQGEGADQSTTGLYDLSAAPAELRPYLEAELKKVEANVTRKFQEGAEYRKRMEPFEALTEAGIEPEELQQLLRFRDIANNEEEFAAWWNHVGDQLGLFADDAEQSPQAEAEPDALMQRIEQLLEQRLEQRLAPITQRFEAQDRTQAVQEQGQQIDAELDSLEQQHGEFDRDAVCQLALAYDTPDAIERAFGDYQRLIGAAESGLVQRKQEQPDSPEMGGRPATGAEPITTFEQASSLARKRLAGSGMT